MGNANFIGRVGALAVALGVGIASAPAVAFAEPTNSDTTSSYDRTALLMGGTTIPKWNDADVEVIMAQFIAPTHPGGMIKPVAVTTPEEGWPITGLIRLIGLALGPPTSSGLAAQRGRMSRGGNSRDSSTSPTSSRPKPGSPIWKRRWRSTATTIW